MCMGKTFAEITLKLTMPIWFHAFEFELVKEEHKMKQPFLHLPATKPEYIPIKLTTRNNIKVPTTQ